MTATEETEPLISSRGLTICGNKPQTVSYDAISLVSNVSVKRFGEIRQNFVVFVGNLLEIGEISKMLLVG